ncbi:Phosphoglycerate mutase [Morganella morganii IS15]|uniref:2,3-diphosphoglycerate-dependent phosphoglycerate mutase GpmB n=1 Tax=Morganella morganii TaxID=582 RepID=UPI0003DBD849|nr:2,3-diphosphoglycerate-dependent phosphoglycerate mutase GpmB [Morganella morganii]CDK68495.1 Phosphoglycerate mutase [Morganella morganii IS15]
MSQVFLVRHGETEWNVQRRIQGHSDSPLTQSGIDQAKQVAARLKNEGITHIIASDLGRTQQTAKLIAEACGCEIIADPRLRELNMGVLEKRQIHTLTAEEEGWRKSLLNGAEDGRIPEGESLAELESRMRAALESTLDLPEGSKVLLVSHGIALGCLIGSVLGLRRMRSAVCVCATVRYPFWSIRKARGWRMAGWLKQPVTPHI